jgi:hypothetical protein
MRTAVGVFRQPEDNDGKLLGDGTAPTAVPEVVIEIHEAEDYRKGGRLRYGEKPL